IFIQHPFIFNSRESLEFLCNLLKQHVLELAPILLRTIEACAPLIITSNQTPILLRTIEACAPLIITSNQSNMLTYVKK
ncbi:unnamed protein product, partial [Rotaria sp. Silwood1]